MPSVLREKKWDCPAAAELTQWTKIFRNKAGKLRLHTLPMDHATEEVQALLIEVSKLRHTAVHRLPTTARGVCELLGSAVKLAQILQDNLRAAQLEELLSDVKSKVEAMELSKNVLEDTVSRELEEIQRKREELDRMEAKLIQGMLKDDMDNKALIGQLLEESVRGIFSKEKREKGETEGEEEEEEEEGAEEKQANETMNADKDAADATTGI